jgi:hypothetical protein
VSKIDTVPSLKSAGQHAISLFSLKTNEVCDTFSKFSYTANIDGYGGLRSQKYTEDQHSVSL